ncbi:MAG TPA: hypothetical protein VIV60_06115 [Polyangiaceae bacterium]
MNKHITSLVLTAAVLVAPGVVSAKPTFPGRIQNHLGLAAPPPSDCLLCHGSKQGGGPIVQPFGKAMVAAGLSASSSEAQLGAALDKLAADNTDSDADGVPDVDALKAGLDPNPSGDPIQYGCGQIAPHGRVGFNASALAFFASIFFLWRSSRRGEKSRRIEESNPSSRV